MAKPDPGAPPAVEAAADAAPAPAAAAGGDTTITLRVKDQHGEETFFKVKRTTKMSKVFSAYSARKGVPKEQLRFLLDGQRINPDDTPDSLELESNDQLDVTLQQLGGCL